MMDPKFGMGIFTISDTSAILNIPRRKISYWFNKYVSGDFERKLGQRYFVDNEVITVNFYTLIETFVFYHLKEKKLKTPIIIQAHNELSKFYQTPYPFALYEFLHVGSSLFHDFEGNIVSLDESRQYAIRRIINQFSEKIDFGPRFAQKYYPMGKKSSIVVNPSNQFGSPIIDGTNIKVSTIFSLSSGGESTDFIADLYDLNEKQVNDAITYMKEAA